MDLGLRVNTKYSENKNSSSELDEPISPTSEYFLSEVVTLYILSFLELAIPVDFASIITFLKNEYLNIHPRLSSIVVEDSKGRKMWKKVEVNVEDHVKVPTFAEDISVEKYSEHFDDYVTNIATSQLPQHKPLWELHIINNPKHINNNASGILIFKIHHAIGDGTSLMGGVLSCFKRVDDPSLPLVFPSKTRTTSSKKRSMTQTMMSMVNIVPRFMYSMLYSLYDLGQDVKTIFYEDDHTPIRSGITDMSLQGSTRVCSISLSLVDVKTIKTLLGVTVNDIILGIIFLGTQLYNKKTDQGQLKNTRSTASIFVNIRSVKGNLSLEEMRKGKTWGNRIANIEVPLPNLEDDDLTNPLQFIQKAHNIIKRKRSGTFGIYFMAGLLEAVRNFGGLQAAARTFARKWKNCSFAITNMIGPTEQVSLANHPVNGFYFVPTGINLSLTVSVLSYMENLRVGLVVENGFIDHQRLITCVENAFHLIFEAAKTNSKSASQQ